MATDDRPPTIKALMRQKQKLQKEIQAARQREHDKTAMSAEAYRRAVEVEFGMTIPQAAVLFGVSTRTSYRWALGELPVPRTVALVLKLMRDYDVKPEMLDRTVKVEEAA